MSSAFLAYNTHPLPALAPQGERAGAADSGSGGNITTLGSVSDEDDIGRYADVSRNTTCQMPCAIGSVDGRLTHSKRATMGPLVSGIRQQHSMHLRAPTA